MSLRRRVHITKIIIKKREDRGCVKEKVRPRLSTTNEFLINRLNSIINVAFRKNDYPLFSSRLRENQYYSVAQWNKHVGSRTCNLKNTLGPEEKPITIFRKCENFLIS